MDKCLICFQKIEYEKKLPCYHSFCFVCILMWYKRYRNCPLCRTEFDLKLGEKITNRYVTPKIIDN